ncbi:DUF4870 family protein [Neisseria animalis]|uniref:DUF4870 domain-containing protein n=1 Tax=Neisseria animalis TaxID=492 RepID=A0A5P3MSM6_NEIAN|nr:hypothetical protein [Neisseria animalis]QEY24528.1 hypothetical protein D0T90_08645 [Neisseria animalis]ROW33055.1 hypothetical protein CGZ60_02070 [Neisseria animalis]VEE07275.1 dnaJ-family protein [Neisseria animalis]
MEKHTLGNNTPEKDNRRTHMMIIYALYALAAITVVSSLVGVAAAYAVRGNMQGTLYESHIRYLIRTFWIGAAGYLLGWLTMGLGVGLLLLFVVSIWFIYRIVAGFVKFYDGRAVEADSWL